MSGWLDGLRVVLGLELRQKLTGVAWWVLLGVYALLLLVVTGVVTFIDGAFRGSGTGLDGSTIYSSIIFVVLLLASLVTPALSGTAINGDRDAGTLATTQVTLITTGQLTVGKFLAAWVAALAFLAASVPFLLFSWIVGGVEVDVVLVSLAVLAVELGVVAAVGVGLSGLVRRPLFSVVVTYLVVAALSVGTLIAFGLGSLAASSPATYTYVSASDYDDVTGLPTACGEPQVTHSSVPRPDRVWGLLATNPYVVLADAIPTHYGAHGEPDDAFGGLKWTVRQAQITPELDGHSDECEQARQGYTWPEPPTAEQTIDSTTPSWFVGLIVQVVLAALPLWGGFARLRTPARRLAAGSRIA
ncbi:ABC transporter permease [Galbitalea sp. SE-J8]|uniref:ABC transporter permease n=1 Tax=Galbitalea sp. SE-J8 TaxID=3054952 RepID=UPI00259CC8B2|nr:ABC transporter permease [Galbitalea sp. SE-J8]MDM4762776.1 ABC transporter permease [Galbitalea sp. SE-J8]